VRRRLGNSVYWLHHIWIAVAVSSLVSLIRVLQLSGERRNSIAANREILDRIAVPDVQVGTALVLMASSLFVIRRRLKAGVLSRLGIRWQRVLTGILVPLLVPFFIFRDIERLSAVERTNAVTSEGLRRVRASWIWIIWPLFLVIWGSIGTRLDYALIGITYVTEGTAAIDDPLRYFLKWIEPSVITTALDSYSQFIWIGAVAYCISLFCFAAVSWALLHRATRSAKQVLL